jgi:hypothetical protein
MWWCMPLYTRWVDSPIDQLINHGPCPAPPAPLRRARATAVREPPTEAAAERPAGAPESCRRLRDDYKAGMSLSRS